MVRESPPRFIDTAMKQCNFGAPFSNFTFLPGGHGAQVRQRDSPIAEHGVTWRRALEQKVWFRTISFWNQRGNKFLAKLNPTPFFLLHHEIMHILLWILIFKLVLTYCR